MAKEISTNCGAESPHVIDADREERGNIDLKRR